MVEDSYNLYMAKLVDQLDVDKDKKMIDKLTSEVYKHY